ncbi:hypothetical protein F4556_004375 [Kitasatospora gansuensis]|uniref:Uncharacterized protein n=1 Tax=Kitasatospora gansuensis TaxID=258050 RepID=A0A7W7WJE1_9ACTN|nr:hypothetical protein [Kitasatospora gansuensis]MBB4948840.1 hypothetical protein [Kitasatospora gansuensis]
MSKLSRSAEPKLPRKNPLEGLETWQKALSILPIALLVVGGAIGGALGAGAFFINTKIARKPLATPAKALAMVGVIAGAGLAYLIVVTLLAIAIGV